MGLNLSDVFPWCKYVFLNSFGHYLYHICTMETRLEKLGPITEPIIFAPWRRIGKGWASLRCMFLTVLLRVIRHTCQPVLAPNKKICNIFDASQG